MAATERANEFMRLFRLYNLDTHCDRLDCHGTHVDRIDWEIARRRSTEIGTLEVMAELNDDDRKTILWVAYVTYARKRYGAQAQPPPFQRKPNVVVPKSVREAGFDPAAVCWACDDPDCRICTVQDGSNRLQQVILREKRVLSIQEYLGREDVMEDFVNDVYGRELEDDPVMSDI